MGWMANYGFQLGSSSYDFNTKQMQCQTIQNSILPPFFQVEIFVSLLAD